MKKLVLLILALALVAPVPWAAATPQKGGNLVLCVGDDPP